MDICDYAFYGFNDIFFKECFLVDLKRNNIENRWNCDSEGSLYGVVRNPFSGKLVLMRDERQFSTRKKVSPKEFSNLFLNSNSIKKITLTELNVFI